MQASPPVNLPQAATAATTTPAFPLDRPVRKSKPRTAVASGTSLQEETWKTVRRLGKGAHGAVWLRQRVRRASAAAATLPPPADVTAATATATAMAAAAAATPATNVAADMFAFKRMANMMQDHATAKQSLRELQFATTLCHPNIVTHHRIHCQSPRTGVFLQMEVMSASLATFSSTMEQQLAPDQVRWLMYQLLCSVNYLHSGGILHRAHTPQNRRVRGGGTLAGGTLASRSFPPFTPLLPLRSRGLLWCSSYGAPMIPLSSGGLGEKESKRAAWWSERAALAETHACDCLRFYPHIR
jgi:serine/threonine protein kinase